MAALPVGVHVTALVNNDVANQIAHTLVGGFHSYLAQFVGWHLLQAYNAVLDEAV
jgi:hypothetical protein